MKGFYKLEINNSVNRNFVFLSSLNNESCLLALSQKYPQGYSLFPACKNDPYFHKFIFEQLKKRKLTNIEMLKESLLMDNQIKNLI